MPATIEVTDSRSNFYTLLGISLPVQNNEQQISKDELKVAYRRALLHYHPDKSVSVTSQSQEGHGSGSPNDGTGVTIDQIIKAYETLSVPASKAAYDKALRSGLSLPSLNRDEQLAYVHEGVETFDLDDLTHDEINNLWSKTCRCGHNEGYVVTESELEEEGERGEVFVGCKGCSLFVRVLFSLAEDGT